MGITITLKFQRDTASVAVARELRLFMTACIVVVNTLGTEQYTRTTQTIFPNIF